MKTKQLNFGPTRLIANMCFGTVLAVIGATAAAFTTTGTPSVSVDGKTFALTAQTNTPLAALAAANLPAATGAQYTQPSGLLGFYTQPANTTVYYVIGVIAAGTWLVVQGTFDPKVQSATLDPMQIGATGGVQGGYGSGKSIIPDVPEGFVPVAIMKVITAGSTFVPATTALTGIATFQNCSLLGVFETF